MMRRENQIVAHPYRPIFQGVSSNYFSGRFQGKGKRNKNKKATISKKLTFKDNGNSSFISNRFEGL